MVLAVPPGGLMSATSANVLMMALKARNAFIRTAVRALLDSASTCGAVYPGALKDRMTSSSTARASSNKT